MKQIILTSILCFMALISLKAQTGSFNKDVSFNGETRQLSFYVPANYDSTKQVGLVLCLHGLGDNSSSYRNAIINSLKWHTIFANSILVFPDGGVDANSDFYAPAGDESFIDFTLNFCKNNYNINSNDVILQGFSLGGRSALKYGLDHPTTLKALLLNTPALQGLLDLQNNPNISLGYEFTNASQLPIFISVGAADDAYFALNEKLAYQLKLSNAAVYFQKIAGMGHTIAMNAQIRKCLNFFEQKAVYTKDIELLNVESPMNVCSNIFTANCFIRNNGVSNIQSFKIKLKIGEQLIEKSIDLLMKPNEFVKIPVEVLLNDKNLNSFTVSIDFLDDDSTNNFISKSISLKPMSSSGIIKEGFENFDNWTIQKSGSLFEWYLDDVTKKSGNKSLGSFNTIMYFNTLNSVESVVSKAVDLSKIDKKTLSFDVAFNYTKYTPPYFATETNFADTLELQISLDCGNTFQTIYKKGGKELATTAEPMLNPLNISQLDFIPNANEWRREIIDLMPYASSNSAVFKINCISGMGGVLNLDNLSFGEDVMSVNQVKKSENHFSVYPNPANETLSFNLERVESIRFLDLEGKLVSETKPELGVQTVNTSHLANGMYIVQFVSNVSVSSKRILIQH
jgi:predicted esterase